MKFILISLLTLLLVSCEEKEWKQSDISLVPVYQVNYLSSNEALEIYQTKPLLLEYENSLLVTPYELENYTDTSTDSLYLIKFSRMDSIVVDSMMAQVSKVFEIKAEMANDTGIMNIVYIYNKLDTIATSTVDISIVNTAVYN